MAEDNSTAAVLSGSEWWPRSCFNPVFLALRSAGLKWLLWILSDLLRFAGRRPPGVARVCWEGEGAGRAEALWGEGARSRLASSPRLPGGRAEPSQRAGKGRRGRRPPGAWLGGGQLKGAAGEWHPALPGDPKPRPPRLPPSSERALRREGKGSRLRMLRSPRAAPSLPPSLPPRRRLPLQEPRPPSNAPRRIVRAGRRRCPRLTSEGAGRGGAGGWGAGGLSSARLSSALLAAAAAAR